MTELEALGIPRFAVITFIVAIGSLVQSTVGFGMALIAAPLLLLIDPAFVPAPMIVTALCLTVMVMLRERRAVEVGQIGWLVSGRLPGAIAGAWLLASAPAQHLDTLLSALILLAVVLTVLAPPIRPTRQALAGAGVVSGIMGTVSSIGGPPVALLLQHAEGQKLRATMSGYFIFSTTLSLGALAWVGHFDVARLRMAGDLLPGCILGFALSTPLRSVVDRAYTRPLVLTLSAVAAVAVFFRS